MKYRLKFGTLKDSKKISISVFVAGLVVYFCGHFGIFAYSSINRSSPIEVDDAYCYIVKAVQMHECFLQNSPALTDLLQQISTPSENYKISFEKYRTYHRNFFIYHTLHSSFLVGIHALGFSWEDAYLIVNGIGTFIMGLSVSFLLYVLWGAGAAGFALFLLSFQIFPEQGIRYIVPSSLALCIGMTTWAAIVRWKDRAGWFMLCAIAAMVAMHLAGGIYSLIAIILYLSTARDPFSKRRLAFFGAGMLLIVIPYIIPHIISRPIVSYSLPEAPKGWDYWSEVKRNFTVAVSVVNSWASSKWIDVSKTASEGYKLFGYTIKNKHSCLSSISVAFLIIIGFIGADSSKKKPIGCLLFLFFGLLVFSLISKAFMVPGYSLSAAMGFKRFWVGFVIILTGAIGNAGWIWLSRLLARFYRKGIDVGTPLPDTSVINLKRYGEKPYTLFIVFLALISSLHFITHQALSLNRYLHDINYVVDEQNWYLDPKQPKTLLSMAKESDTVLYMRNEAMQFFFTHGTYRLGAVYSRVVMDTPEEDRWIKNNSKIKYLVTLNPLEESIRSRLFLNKYKSLGIISEEAIDKHSIYIKIENHSNKPVTLNIYSEQGNTKYTELHIERGFSGWVQVFQTATASGALKKTQSGTPQAVTDIHRTSHSGAKINGILVKTKVKDLPVIINGVRIGKEKDLNWPWDQGISLVLSSESNKRSFSFKSSSLYPRNDRSFKVLADSGVTLFAEVVGSAETLK